MWKYLVIASFMFGGCANWEFNVAMCDKIATDPNAEIPEECRNYNEKEAQKAFDKVSKKKEESKDDIVKFNRDDNEEEN